MGTQLLSLLDGLVSMEDVVVLGTTNRVDAIDPALRRPGRFDREIFVGPPDAAGRLEIFKIHTRGMPLTENAQSLLPDLAQATHGYTGADIVDLLREAGLHALRRIVGPAELAGQAETLMGCAVEPNDLQDALEHTRPSSLRQTLMAATRASWDDIVGQDAVVQRLREAVEMPLTHRMAFDDIGLVASPGVVLHGPPGSGKTVLAMAVAHESHANVVTLNGPEVFSKWLGKSEEAVREVFRLARQASPTVVILDQLDAMASRRSDSSSSSALERVVNQLLIELDDVASRNLSVIGITNRLDLVDPALLRPGRLGIHIAVELPDASERAAMIRRYLRGSTTAKDGDATTWSVVAKVADVSVGLSGADLRAVCNDARILALRDAGYRVGARVEPKHLEQAFEAQQRQPRESALVRQDIHHKVVSREWSVDEVV
jgi:transitional endoplasmic reticulum ATPase